MTTPLLATRPAPEQFDDAFRGLARAVESGIVPVAALAIGNADGPVRIETFAGRSRERIDNESVFFLASVTKPIMATGVMQLVQEGLLDLHAPVARHVPGFDVPGRDTVTPWHLLTHTSGVPDIPADLIRSKRPSRRQMTELASSAELRFAPGTRWEYCSSSFYILGELMRVLTGLRYPDYLRRRLLEPLEMRHTTFDPRRLGRKLVPVHGVGADNRLRRFLILRYLVSIAQPGGGLWGTLDDLLRFGAALLRPRAGERGAVPLSPATIELMTADHTRGLVGTFDGVERPVHFGLGWGKPTLMADVPGSTRVYSHGGATGTRIWIDPDADLVFVYLTNQWAPDPTPQLDALRATYAALGAG